MIGSAKNYFSDIISIAFADFGIFAHIPGRPSTGTLAASKWPLLVVLCPSVDKTKTVDVLEYLGRYVQSSPVPRYSNPARFAVKGRLVCRNVSGTLCTKYLLQKIC